MNFDKANFSIAVDMDGVLVDCLSGLLKILGSNKTPDDLSCWSLCEALNMTHEDFWLLVNAGGSEFWANLEPYPWAFSLWQVANDVSNNNAYILSAPSRDPQSAVGKIEWIKKHLKTKQYFLGSKKYLLAHPKAVLVDDKPENCERWENAGGKAIMFPTPWNGKCNKVGEKVQDVFDELQSLNTTNKTI